MKLPIIIISMILLISGCDKMVNDKYTSSKMDDSIVKKMMSPIEDEEQVSTKKLQQPEIVIPEYLKQKVSLVLNETLPIRTVLCETAKKLNINFQMDPNIKSKLIFQAHHKTFIEVLDAICDMTNLRYTITNDIVKVVQDTPYSEIYNIQFLNFSRDSENKISIETEVATSETDDKKKIKSTDSNVTIKGKSNFWEELDNSLKIMLNSNKHDGFRYSINKHSGIVTVFANSKFQKSVKNYIEKVKESIMNQVLIEAKIIEVTLKNEYRRGIDWGIIGNRLSVSGNLGQNSASGVGVLASKGIVSFTTSRQNGEKNDIKAVLQLLEEFGSTRTISNPRITAMNNQAAVLKVAQNHVYFKLNYDKTYASATSDRTDISVSSDIKTVPIGLVMFVQPSIDTSNNSITLFLRPTITRLSDQVVDPAVEIAMKANSGTDGKNYEQSRVPVTEVREITSVLKLEDGEIAVLGGFMESRSSKNKTGIPGLRDKPIIGEIASSHGMGDEIIELVILIKVTLANKPRRQKATDLRLQRFVVDPRPF